MPGREARRWVASLEGCVPVQVARAVLHETDHHLLVGPARAFRAKMGFAIEDDLNTGPRQAWLEWCAGRSTTTWILHLARKRGCVRAIEVADG